MILATAGAGYWYYVHLNHNLAKDALNLGSNKLDKAGPNANGQTPLNILLLGSDSRKSKKNVELGGADATRDRPPLADVQMLLHVSADRSNMSVISVPRDTKATIPKCTDSDNGKVFPKTVGRINTSLQHGGPGCTVATWEEMTGIPVDHFMMIDFAGVVSMADAVGGVPVCVDKNVHDPQSELRLKKGKSVVRGEQALHWLRTRHGFGDGTDIGRARAQHMYMNSMVRQLKAGTKLTDPGKLRNLSESATNALTVDHGIGTVDKLYDLGNDLKRVPTRRITMATMPWRYGPNGYVVPKENDADHTFSLIRHDVALDGKDKKKHHRGTPEKKSKPAPAHPKSQIPLHVINGTGTAVNPPVTGRAGAIAEHLGTKGYRQATAQQTRMTQTDTTISYRSTNQRADALAVAKSLDLPAGSVRRSTGVQDVTLVVGDDWRSGTTYPEQSGGASGGGSGTSDGTSNGTSGGTSGGGGDKAPGSADALNGSDKRACMDVNPQYTW
jgi:LCP family protein required for cell wall assembly